jgi:hypothetical protein
MSAQRKLIRTAAAAWLMNATPVGQNVFPSRSAPLWDHDDVELPATCIYSGRETITIERECPRKYRRELELKFEVGATGRDADDQLDDIGDAIERRIGRSNRLTYAKEQTVANIVLTSEQIEFREDGRKTVGVLVIVYTVTYYTYEPDEFDPEPLDDLRRVHTDYSLNGEQQPADRARDRVELPTA